MDDVFKALADPSRRRLLDSLNLRDGQTLGELCRGLEMTRQSVSKHLAVLEGAGLVTTERRGRQKLHHLDTGPINALSDRWIRHYGRARLEAHLEMNPAPEPEPAADPDAFVYTIYIRTTPERLWQALTVAEFSRRHMGHALVSTWQKGAAYTWVDGASDAAVDATDQVVVDVDPYRRLALIFPRRVPSMADDDPEMLDRAAAEPPSRVSFDIRPAGDEVELTLVHDGFPTDSVTRRLVSRGWPRKLSDLKSGLEELR